MDNLKREYSWMGYGRSTGAMGIRNKVLVIYTVECASFVAREIVRLAGDPEVRGGRIFGLYRQPVCGGPSD